MSGGLVTAIEPGGLGERLGLEAGDHLLSVNGHPLRDTIDLQFYGSEEAVALTVQRGGKGFTVRGARRYDEAWGVEFAEPLFDGIRTCGNHCPYCFVSGLPPGLRPSLYVRDDDYRLSFLYGNFVTLTNLKESDWQRLAVQRLSPMYVSVHATEPDLRRRLLGGRPIPDIRQQIERLGEMGIAVEAQVVICPGLNDGQALERTVGDLWRLRRAVESVALVPVGLTRYHPARLRPVTAELATEILHSADGWRRMAYREAGRRFVYPSDEIYLLAGRAVPGARAYDGFPQLANGVGLVRRFLDDWARARRRLARREGRQPGVASVTLVSGRAFEPFVRKVAEGLSEALGMRAWVVGVTNHFLGEQVTVAGLLSGQDVAQQLARCEVGDLVILPRSMFDTPGGRTLDDWTPERLAEALGRPIAMAGLPSEVVAILKPAG